MRAVSAWQSRLDAAAPGLVERSTLVGERPRSVILRGWSPEFGEVCIKFDPKAGGRARMQAEYDALRAYHAATRESGPFGAPRPCALVPDPQGGAALVTTWISCPRADDRMARILPFGADRKQVLVRAAGWLAHFHRIGPAEEVRLRSILDLPSLEAELRASLHADGVERGGDPAAATLAHAIVLSADAAVSVTRIHGDFLPQNLFLCGDQTIGIDFTLDVRGPALRDVGLFLANMIWRGYSTVDPWSPARFARDADTFLAAYYAGAAPTHRQVAQLFILAALARKAENLAAKIAGRRFRASDRLHRAMIIRAIRHLIRRYPVAVQQGTPPA